MNAEIIKLGEDKIEVDGVTYKREGNKAEGCMKAWVRKNQLEECQDNIEIEGRCLVFPLPNANNEWSLEVFDKASNALRHFKAEGYLDSYIEHRDSHTIYLNIR